MNQPNPYQSPVQQHTPNVRGSVGIAAVAADAVSRDPGPWRDEESLVILINNPQFPSRCIKTNESIQVVWTTLRVSWIPSHHVWLLTLGLLGHLIAKATVGRTFTVQAPISPRWLARHKLVACVGWGMVITGVAGFVVGTVVSIVTAFQTVDATSRQFFLSDRKGPSVESVETDSNTALALTLASPVISLAGIVVLALRHKPIVVARNVVGEYAWLNGVNREYLGSLALWPGSHR